MAQQMSARARLDRYRALVTAASPVADVLADRNGLHLEATGLQPGEPEIICSLPPTCPVDNRELIRRHIEIPADLIGMLDAAARRDAERRHEIERLREALTSNAGKPTKDYAAECAMKCAEPEFMQFLNEKHDLPPTADAQETARRIRSVLNITSRSQLNTVPAAAARWRKMAKEFEAWRKTG